MHWPLDGSRRHTLGNAVVVWSGTSTANGLMTSILIKVE
jgi:hypothetical protein